MITEDYVSFETAKLLKEKGFDQECDYATSWYAKQYYKNPCVGEWFEGEHQIIEDIDVKCNISYLSEKDVFIPAPTLQMAMKWLMEVHDIFITVIQAESTTVTMEQEYFSYRIQKKRRTVGVFTDTFKNPCNACDSAIKYVLENLI